MLLEQSVSAPCISHGYNHEQNVGNKKLVVAEPDCTHAGDVETNLLSVSMGRVSCWQDFV